MLVTVSSKCQRQESFKYLDFEFLNIVDKGLIAILKVVVNYPYSLNTFINELLSYSWCRQKWRHSEGRIAGPKWRHLGQANTTGVPPKQKKVNSWVINPSLFKQWPSVEQLWRIIVLNLVLLWPEVRLEQQSKVRLKLMTIIAMNSVTLIVLPKSDINIPQGQTGLLNKSYMLATGLGWT